MIVILGFDTQYLNLALLLILIFLISYDLYIRIKDTKLLKLLNQKAEFLDKKEQSLKNVLAESQLEDAIDNFIRTKHKINKRLDDHTLRLSKLEPKEIGNLEVIKIKKENEND